MYMSLTYAIAKVQIFFGVALSVLPYCWYHCGFGASADDSSRYGDLQGHHHVASTSVLACKTA
jgi:hypothetical protein